jgi:hypothetical protein
MAVERWALVFEDGALWLHERVEGDIRDRRITRDEVQRQYPRLFAALLAADNKDTPKIVREPRR